MAYRIDDIEGIGPAFASKLNNAGITTTDALLEQCGQKAGRRTVAETTGIPEKNILTWTNRADLMRISGVGGQFAELLEGAGVDTVKELARRNPANLTAKMTEINAERNLAKNTPAVTQVTRWVSQAGELPPGVHH